MDIISTTRHNIYDKTSLSWAAVNGREAVIKLLLKKGTDVESKNWGDAARVVRRERV